MLLSRLPALSNSLPSARSRALGGDLKAVWPTIYFKTGSFSHRRRWNSVSQRPGSDQWVQFSGISDPALAHRSSSVHFPGAVNSKFSTQLEFVRPSTNRAIPTYRVMDSDGTIVDEARKPDVSKDEVLKWYTNMLTGMWSFLSVELVTWRAKHVFVVSIMDLIMFDAQRQGRLSFYMVGIFYWLGAFVYLLTVHSNRFQLVKRESPLDLHQHLIQRM